MGPKLRHTMNILTMKTDWLHGIAISGEDGHNHDQINKHTTEESDGTGRLGHHHKGVHQRVQNASNGE